MTISALQHLCANHPDRAASALCVSCRRSICQECATQWDGINYCVQCLSRRRAEAPTQRGVLRSVLLIIVAIFSFWLCVKMMVIVGTFVTEAVS